MSKRILITGSTMGIGFGAAAKFHAAGDKVAIHGRAMERVQSSIAELGGGDRLVPVVGDTSDVDSCKDIVNQAIDKLGGLDCLVANAGVGDLAVPEDITEEHWDKMVAINVRGYFFLAQCALPELKKNGGNIVFNASVGGLAAGPIDSTVYAMTKGAVVSLTRALALEVVSSGVRVNAICPGYIQTPMIDAENEATDGQIFGYIEECVPMSRLGSMEECAKSIYYLASDSGSYSTGTMLVNDGGAEALRTWGGRS